MNLKFHRETKIIFAILSLIIIASAIWIAINYRKLKQPIKIPQNSVAQAQVKGAEIPIQPRGSAH